MTADMRTERMLLTHQLIELPRAIRYAVRRLLRREARWYLTLNGDVVARFTSAADYGRFMAWVADSHIETYDLGHTHGVEVANAFHKHREDRQDLEALAGHAGTP
jgi:hypothetical protein